MNLSCICDPNADYWIWMLFDWFITVLLSIMTVEMNCILFFKNLIG